MQKKTKRKLTIAGIFLITVFIILSIIVGKDAFRNLDYVSMVFLQNFFTRNIDVPFSYITLLGSSEIMTVMLGTIFLFVLVKKRRLFLGLALYFLIFIFEFMGKMFIYHPDPPPNFSRYALNIHLPSSFVIDTNYSYPSGHMARSSFLAVTLLILILSSKITKPKKAMMSVFLTALILMVLVSRIYLGEHWFSDVLGGLLLGSSMAVLSFAF